jgi:hypothetical protein
MERKTVQNLIKPVLISFFFAIIIACGYVFAPQGEYISKKIVKIYIGQFNNKTSQAELENYVRSAFIYQFIQTPHFKVVDNAEQSDAVIKGSVLTLTTSPLSYRRSTLAAEERATITMELSFLEKDSGKEIWKSSNIVGTVDYTVESNINLLTSTRKTAYIKLANVTAEKTFNIMMSGF